MGRGSLGARDATPRSLRSRDRQDDNDIVLGVRLSPKKRFSKTKRSHALSRLNTNTPKAAFWLLAYMIYRPELLGRIRAETSMAFSDNLLNIDVLNNSCPLLTGAWMESLRLASSSASVRFITRDTRINGKMLRKGNTLMIPYRQLHFDEAVFGQDVESFNAERFLKRKNLAKSPSWRPFGGGRTLCPGRFMAQQSVFIFVAMLLNRFDVTLATPQSFPRPDEGKPVLGVMGSKDDLAVRLTPRICTWRGTK